MMRANYLCQIPQVRKGDASLWREIFNNVSRNMNALQALSLNVNLQDLRLRHLM